MNRYDIINTLVVARNYTDYLEIGIKNGNCFKEVVCGNKTGVDPNPIWSNECVLRMTSDEFFGTNNRWYDIIFIDGLHYHEQVLEDISNALRCLKMGGTILLHDINPIDKKHQVVPIEHARGTWNGDCWKAFVMAREKYPFEMFTINTDHGIGVIYPYNEAETLTRKDPLHYECLDNNREEWLNLRGIEHFEEWLINLT